VNGISNYWAPSKTMANPDLKWETTITRNIGLDFTLFGGKLSGTLDAYINTTKDLLIEFPVQGTGYDTQYRNLGKTQNKGIEFSFTYHIVNKKDWGIDFSGNINFNKNEVKDLGIMEDFGKNTAWASTEIGNDYWIAVGSPLGQIQGYLSDGRYEVSDFESYDAATNTWKLKEGVANASDVVGAVRPGMMKIKNLVDPVDADGNVDPEKANRIGAEDITIIGDVNPTALVDSTSMPVLMVSTLQQASTTASAIRFTMPTRLSILRLVNISTVT
jgi:hypothetical protein